MTIKEIIKSVEGIAVLAAFILTIITGAKIFSYLGIAAYLVINLNGALKKLKEIGSKVINFFKEKF